jgi:hypothetical protein
MAPGAISRDSGFYTVMGTNKILAPLQDLVPTLSGPYSCHYSLACVWDLHFKLTCQVCFFLPRLHQTANSSGGDENDLLLWSPWQPLSWSALTLWAPSSPCQQEAVTEQTLLSLILTTVRAITERRDLKDRLQEVKETLLLPRKCLFASERHLCPQTMQK